MRRAYYGLQLARDGKLLLGDARKQLGDAEAKLQEMITAAEADPIDLLKLQTFAAELAPKAVVLFVFLNDFDDLEVYRDADEIANLPETGYDYAAIRRWDAALAARRPGALRSFFASLPSVRLLKGVAKSLSGPVGSKTKDGEMHARTSRWGIRRASVPAAAPSASAVDPTSATGRRSRAAASQSGIIRSAPVVR